MQLLQSLDLALFHLINLQMANPFFDVFFPTITDLHKTDAFRIIFLPFVLLLFIYLHRLRGLVMFLLLGLSLGLSDALGGIAKRYWLRPRPFTAEVDFIQRSAAGGYSFPSNHSMNMFCAAVFLSMLFPRFRIAFFAFAFLVALSRIYNGVHYPSDVIGGALIGSFFGFVGAKIALQINQRIEKGFKKKRKPKNV